MQILDQSFKELDMVDGTIKIKGISREWNFRNNTNYLTEERLVDFESFLAYKNRSSLFQALMNIFVIIFGGLAGDKRYKSEN